MTALGVSPTLRDEPAIVRLTGEYDLASVPALSRLLDEAWRAGGDVVVDFSSVDFFDASTLGVIVAAHHRATFGDRPYTAFADDYRAGLEQWDPEGWARRFAAAGARYVVLVAKHHDGFCLWPSAVTNPHRAGWDTGRDVVGELAEAVRGQGLRFGVYYSGGLDWTFNPTPVGTTAEVAASVPQGAYPAYAEAQVRELVERYRPSVLWNDIAWPMGRKPLQALVDWYREQVPDGVINDRWMPWSPAWKALQLAPVRALVDRSASAQARKTSGLMPPKTPIYDVRTPEYAVFDTIRPEPWECVRGIDRSFGFNRASEPDHFLSRGDLLDTAIDIASKGGNLLLNVGPRGEDAQIPAEQLLRLEWLGEWSASVADGLYGTRPWVRPAATSAEGHALRFTAGDSDLWVHVLAEDVDAVTVPGVAVTAATTSSVGGQPAAWTAGDTGVRIELPGPRSRPVIRLGPVEARPV